MWDNDVSAPFTVITTEEVLIGIPFVSNYFATRETSHRNNLEDSSEVSIILLNSCKCIYHGEDWSPAVLVERRELARRKRSNANRVMSTWLNIGALSGSIVS